jgi:translation initiation factor IF-1
MTSKLRKHVDQDQDTLILPDEGQQIVKVIDVRGGNLVEVEFDDQTTTLCIIPSKYRKKVWIKKGTR